MPGDLFFGEPGRNGAPDLETHIRRNSVEQGCGWGKADNKLEEGQ